MLSFYIFSLLDIDYGLSINLAIAKAIALLPVVEAWSGASAVFGIGKKDVVSDGLVCWCSSSLACSLFGAFMSTRFFIACSHDMVDLGANTQCLLSSSFLSSLENRYFLECGKSMLLIALLSLLSSWFFGRFSKLL